MDDEHELEAHARTRIGTVLREKYRLDAILGVGGMAVVYKATHRNTAEFAVKMLHPELCARQSVRTRFLREGYAANSVKHPGAVRVVDDDVAEDGAAFLVMELLDGISADHLLEQPGGPPPVQVALAIGVQLLDVLAAAHASGIVHRDIKPANLFLTRDGTVKVLDFGIARALDESSLSGPQLTGAGMPLGTPAFMAPEQALAKSSEIDAQTDVWAAGATLFALITGDVVHSGEVAAQVLVAAATTPARALASVAPGVPPPIAAVVDRALAFDKAARWASAAAMRDALTAACREAGVEAPGSLVIAERLTSGRATVGVTAPAAYAPTAESIPPPARPSASREATAPAVSSTPRPRTGTGPTRRRWTGALALGATMLLLAGVPLGVRLWRARAGRWTSSPPSRSAATASAALVPKTSHVSVLVLGVENHTQDPLFDGTIESILSRALGRSHALSAYSPGMVRHVASELGMDPEHAPDEQLAKKFLARDGGTVLTVRGNAALKGSGYSLSITATNVENGAVVFSGARDAANGAAVVPSIGRVACDLRAALGDSPPTDPRVAEQTGLSASLEADHETLVGTRLIDLGKYEEGVTYLRRALEIDPGFAKCHWLLGNVLSNLGRHTESAHELDLALKASGEMGDVERAELQADYFESIGAYDRAIASLGEVLEKVTDDLHADTALLGLYWQTNQIERALDLARRTNAAHPTFVIGWTNLAGTELRASNLDRTVEVGEKTLSDFARPPPHTYVNLAVAEALLGHEGKAADAYGKLLSRDASLANHGLADLALSEGRDADATALLVKSLAADITEKNADATARKRVLLAEARWRRNDAAGAMEAAQKATSSADPATLFAAGEAQIQARGLKGAREIAVDLAKSPAQEARMFAKILEADALRAEGKAREGLLKLDEAEHISDSWLGHLSLARAHLDLGEYGNAEREIRVCIARRGEGALAFDADAPSARFVPPLTYYLARALEGQGRAEAKATYEAFLALVAQGDHDPLADDARRRLARR